MKDMKQILMKMNCKKMASSNKITKIRGTIKIKNKQYNALEE